MDLHRLAERALERFTNDNLAAARKLAADNRNNGLLVLAFIEWLRLNPQAAELLKEESQAVAAPPGTTVETKGMRMTFRPAADAVRMVHIGAAPEDAIEVRYRDYPGGPFKKARIIGIIGDYIKVQGPMLGLIKCVKLDQIHPDDRRLIK